MTGYNVFYPFGFDDNGLPTERLVEKEFGIKAHEVSREEFRDKCMEVAKNMNKIFAICLSPQETVQISRFAIQLLAQKFKNFSKIFSRTC